MATLTNELVEAGAIAPGSPLTTAKEGTQELSEEELCNVGGGIQAGLIYQDGKDEFGNTDAQKQLEEKSTKKYHYL